MIVTADWVVPVSSPPIRAGALQVRGARITSVGTLAEMTKAHPSDDVHELPGCIVAPGLVNAHTHLALSALAGLIDERQMVPWLSSVVRATRELSADDLADSAALGAVRCLEAGVTWVGDIAYGPESLSAAGDLGLGGVFFWEILGIAPSMLAETLAEREFPTTGDACRGRSRCGLSPHAPYTSGPSLIRAVHTAARDADVPFAIHLAESRAESQLTINGGGPLADPANRLAYGFHPPHKSPVSYVDALGALERAIAIHCVNLNVGDARKLARHASGVVLCPRSNEYLGNGSPPVDTLTGAGVTLALGTDSAASNDDLDLFAEARALRRIAPELSDRRVLEIMTVEGARVLGLQGLAGTIEADASADIIAVEAAPTDDPVGALLAKGGRDNLRAVMSAGTWRILDGRSTLALRGVEKAGARVTEKARAALARA